MPVYKMEINAILQVNFTRSFELEVEAENEEAALAMVKEYEGRAMRGSSPFGDMVFQQTGGVDLLDPQSYEDCENDILELDVGAIERIREEQKVFR